MYEARSFARQGKQYSKMRDLSAEYTDLDTPMYDIETGNDVNLIAMYIKELLSIVHRGLPVEYREVNDDLNFIRGKLNIIPRCVSRAEYHLLFTNAEIRRQSPNQESF